MVRCQTSASTGGLTSQARGNLACPDPDTEIKDRVGGTAVHLYGRTWIKNGWLVPHPNGDTTYNMRVANKMSTRVLLIPQDRLAGATDET